MSMIPPDGAQLVLFLWVLLAASLCVAWLGVWIWRGITAIGRWGYQTYSDTLNGIARDVR